MPTLTPVFFDHSVRGLFVHALGERLTPALRQQLAALGIDLEQPLLPAYPAELFRAAVELVGAALYPELPVPQVHFRMGAHALVGFQKVAVGESMFEYLKVITPERSLQRMERNLRAAMNFVELQVQQIAPTTWDLTLKDTAGMPEFFRALLEKGASAAGRGHVTVTLVEEVPPGARMRYQL